MINRETLQRGIAMMIAYHMASITGYLIWKHFQLKFISELKSEIGTRSFNYLIKAHRKFGKGGELTVAVLRGYSREELLSFYGIGEKTVERILSFKTSREKYIMKIQRNLKKENLKEKEVV
jgi:endonuclease III-like uncharacterized protein